MTKLVNRAKMTTATTGTGTITLGSAVDGSQAFANAGVTDGDVVRYVIEDGSDWEIGTGTYTASGTTLSRTVSESSNADAALNLTGSAVVYVTATNADFREEGVGTISGSTLDLTSGNVFSYTPAENTTFVFSNPPASGTAYGMTLKVTGADVAAGYDLANASYDGVSFSVTGQDSTPTSMTFKPDGTKMYVAGFGSDSVNQYSLSTAFDLSTASYDSVSFSFTSQDTSPYDIAFNNNGTKMYVLGQQNDALYQYSLSTAFNVSTASYDSVSFSVADQDLAPTGVTFSSDGTKMYVLGNTGDSVFQYSLSTAFDLSTASYDSVSFSIASQDTSPFGLYFTPDGSKMYILGFANDSVFQYTTGTTPAPATFAYPTSVDWPSGTAPDAPADGETDVLVFYTEDGGTTYYGFQAGDAMA